MNGQMEKEKQIDEIAKLICTYPQCVNYNKIGGCKIAECQTVDIAENLYNAGYRKTIMCCECKYCEVVIDSIIDEPKWFCTRMVGSMPVDPTDYCSRAKMKGAE